MTVAMSAAPREPDRSATVSALTPVPAAVNAGRSDSSSHRCSRAGNRSRAPSISLAKPSFSAMTALASELARIHSACSAEEVS